MCNYKCKGRQSRVRPQPCRAHLGHPRGPAVQRAEVPHGARVPARERHDPEVRLGNPRPASAARQRDRPRRHLARVRGGEGVRALPPVPEAAGGRRRQGHARDGQPRPRGRVPHGVSRIQGARRLREETRLGGLHPACRLHPARLARRVRREGARQVLDLHGIRPRGEAARVAEGAPGLREEAHVRLLAPPGPGP